MEGALRTALSEHIQWHPEAMLVASDDMLPVFTGLIEAAKKAADK